MAKQAERKDREADEERKMKEQEEVNMKDPVL